MLKGPITEIGELRPGQEVFKSGRTTNDTRGRIGEYRAFTFRRDGFEYNGERYLELTWGYRHTIHRIKEIDPWFAAPGDSGASAIDWGNRLVGILHSGIADGGEGTTYVTTKTSIIYDIKARWGHIV